MSGITNLNTRLNFRGGKTAEGRFQLDKLKTLKKALLYSYQAATAVIDGKEFRCLINRNKLKADYDCKILSIPYEDICLGEYDEETGISTPYKPNGKTTQNFQSTGIENGKVFLWKETNTHWITYLQHLEEDAYYRAEIYRCDAQVEINNHKYYVYIRGPVETTIQWNQKAGINWNNINYSLILYITKNEETLDYFHRFTKIRIDNNIWEVDTVDPYSADGIIEVCLGECYNNEFEDTQTTRKPPVDDIMEGSSDAPYIEGPASVHPFDTVEYIIHGSNSGEWIISDNRKAKFVKSENDTITIEIVSGKSGEFELSYAGDDFTIGPLVVKINSL